MQAIHWRTISVEKATFPLFVINHAHLKMLTNQAIAVRHHIRKLLLRWCEETETPKQEKKNRITKTLFNAICYQNGELVDSIWILITCCDTLCLKKLVTCKFGALLWWKMIDICQKEFINRFYVLINWRKWKWHQRTSRFTGSIWGWRRGRLPSWNRERTKADSFLIDFDSY